MTKLPGLNFKALFLFSLPSIFASLLEPLAGVVDTALVGRLDTLWLSSMSIALIIMSSFTWMFNFLVHASTQSVSEAFGQSNYKKLTAKIKVSLLVALGIGVLSTFLLYLFKDFLYVFTGAKREMIPLVDEYFIIRLIGHTFTLLYTTQLSILRGLGRVNLSFILVGITTALNILISYLLLYVFDYGLKGAAIGTVSANVIGLGLSLIFLFKEKIVREFWNQSEKSRDNILSFGKNSLDLFGRSLSLTLCFFLCTKIAAEFGVESLAAHQILLQVWLFSSFFIDGVAITGNVVGSNLMAKKDIVGLRKLSEQLLFQGLIIGFIFTFVYYFFASFIQNIFTLDSRVIEIMATIWPILALSQVLASIAYVYDGLLFGQGSFSFVRKHMMIAVGLVFIPIAGYAYYTQSLYTLWMALIALLIYRSLSGHHKTRSIVGAHYGRIWK